ncbi:MULTISPECIES: putative bifunctional diguanylate cyclase/phosphodiesterase [Stutzerimonas stutzeri subgroup]|uniref:putative bifunctional diguanylate cyclase/phosphodiesterase n=1 Tax=Stutzerimonas stutzeri subgroup TaxID=578833 RepID=UPI000CBEDF7A|nr:MULTISPECIES: EAL domain-containing protein [Stutzerimonas stutzeri subgroup]PKM11101.1 MAG: sensor domain-containing diguanylate cyclase [Gammaproteobacteria bacterium HGW-Gammaproteobacteria-5]
MLTRLSLRKSLPLLLGIFGLMFTVLLTTWHLPTRIEETLTDWRDHTAQHLALLQSSLSDHRRLGRNAELETELADLASLEGVRWAMVIGPDLQIIATTRLGLTAERLELIDAAALKAHVDGGRPAWAGEGARQLAIYPLDRVAQNGTPVREALLAEYDFTPMLAQTKRDAWFYLAQTLTLLLLLGLILNRIYGRLLTRRLARIDQAARQFAIDQRPQTLAVAGRDEIGRLAATLSRMMNQLHERQLALSESEQLLRDLIDTAPIGMLVVDRELRVLQANPAAAALFGCTPEELIGNLPGDRLAESDATARLRSTPANTTLELTGRRNGQDIPLEISCTPFQRYGVRHFLVLLRDISDRLRAEQRLRFLAHFDPLTQLANRNYLMQRLDQLLAARLPLSLLYLDLDHFKRINDSLGHEIGDKLLIQIGDRLGQLMPEKSLLSRTGGDEFMLLLDSSDARRAEQLAKSIIERFELPVRIGQYECFVSPSIGIAVSDGRHSATELLKRVDLALYAAKDAGRNRTVIYNEALSDAAASRRELEQALRHALDRGEFVLHYQPQVNAQGEPEVMEALLRWASPDRGLVPPGEFIPVLEESGMIIEATRWVFREACRQACRWHAMGHALRIAVNLSPLDFRQADLAGSLLAILEEEGASASMLELEVTESALLEADEHVQQTLGRLKAAGLPLLLDDFGTGYASLTYLQRFRFDGIKIDREFVSGLPDSEQSVALVRGILTMASHLGLHVVAEGVENERQAAFLRLNGCPSLQGFHYARPQPAAQCRLQQNGRPINLQLPLDG